MATPAEWQGMQAQLRDLLPDSLWRSVVAHEEALTGLIHEIVRSGGSGHWTGPKADEVMGDGYSARVWDEPIPEDA